MNPFKHIQYFILASIIIIANSPQLSAQGDPEPFPDGMEGELYYCPRIDLVPAEEDGPLFVELDGFLDEVAWERAAWHGWTYNLDNPRGGGGIDADLDFNLEWAALVDDDNGYLYVAWRVKDDALKIDEEIIQCDVWKDDSVELYIDALNDGPDCTAGTNQCYREDDAQITVGANNIIDPSTEFTDPEELIFGGLAGGNLCDFSGPHPEVCSGVVIALTEDDNPIGWQAEIAIPIETLGNNEDYTPTWEIFPEHGTVIGWNIHANDDDGLENGTDRDSKLIWSKLEAQESSWRNPGVYGKLMFVDPTLPPPPLYKPVEDLTCDRNIVDGSVTLSWTNPDTNDPAVPIKIIVDDVEVDRIPGSSIGTELGETFVPLDGFDYTVGVVNNSAVAITCIPANRLPTAPEELENPGGELLINGGGGLIDVLDTINRTWKGDEIYLAPDQSITEVAAFGGEIIDISLLDDQDIPNEIILAERWCDCGINYKLLVPDDTYYVTLYFSENCVDCVSSSLGGNNADAATARIFDVEVEGQIVENFNQADAAIDPPDDGIGATLTATQLYFEVLVEDRILDISVIDQGAGNPPENAAIKAISIVRKEDIIQEIFRRGDVDGNGNIELTDPINNLTYQFLGLYSPECLDACDWDDNGLVDISDPIANLTHQFLGGPPSPLPGVDSCGPDPTEDDATVGGDLGCLTTPLSCE